MGLYQFIREQGYRNDLVGELGRWMLKNFDKRPDPDNPAFILARVEFTSSGNWTRKEARVRLNKSLRLQKIIKLEPRIGGIFKEILQMRAIHGYNRHIEYSRIKIRLFNLVGAGAEKDELSTSACYDVVIHTIDNLLPPDISNLYPDGLPEDVNLDL